MILDVYNRCEVIVFESLHSHTLAESVISLLVLSPKNCRSIMHLKIMHRKSIVGQLET